MKKIIALVPSLLFITVTLFSQYDYVYNDYRERDRNRYDYNNDYRNTNYQRNHNVYARMSYKDRKKLRKLERRLQDRVDCAWEDGRISKKDRRRINDVKKDIDKLIYPYLRRDRYNDSRRNNNSRGNRWQGCR